MCENNIHEMTTGVSKVQQLNLPCAQERFIDILRNLQVDEKSRFLDWIKGNWMQDSALPSDQGDLPDDVLNAIASDLRDNLPPGATLPSENIRSSTDGTTNPDHTLHVDSFLYDDELLDTLCDDGKVERNYCVQCGSHKTQPLTFVSHSLSKQQLLYIFTAILPPLDGKVVLDVGSRLGAALYGAFLYTKAMKIVGIEINSDFCKLQKEVIKKYGFQERIEVVEGNILDRADVILAADIIIFNNVFECFMTPEKQVDVWKYLKQVIKRGTLVITIPAIENVFAIQHTGIELTEWLQEVPFYNPDVLGITDTATEDMANMKLYQVL